MVKSLMAFVFAKTTPLRKFLSIRFPDMSFRFRSIYAFFLGYPTSHQYRLREIDFSTQSQALQDVFARLVASWTGARTYLEIGAGHFEFGSNTYVLEKQGWKGVSIEIDPELVASFRANRKNEILQMDALAVDYANLGRDFNSHQIGYLQVDIDPAPQSLAVLKSLPLQDLRFAGITFEHDSYAVGNRVRNESRRFLRGKGYVLVRGDVTWSPGSAFEDWWVDPDQLGKEGVRALRSKLFGVWRPIVGPFGL